METFEEYLKTLMHVLLLEVNVDTLLLAAPHLPIDDRHARIQEYGVQCRALQRDLHLVPQGVRRAQLEQRLNSIVLRLVTMRLSS
jgi:hypothetical protein